MARFGSDLERDLDRIPPPSFGLGDLERRRSRRATGRRVRAGVVAVLVAGVGTVVVLRTLPSGNAPAAPSRPHAVTSFFVGERPSGIALADGSLWVGHRTLGEVWRLDPASGRVQARIPTGGQGPAAVAAGAGQVWAVTASGQASTLLRIDPAADAVVASRPVDLHVDAIAVRDDRVWLASRSADAVLVLSPGGRELARVAVAGGPAAIALDPGGAWVAGGSSGGLSRIALPDYRASARPEVGGRPTGLAICGGEVWVSTGAGALRRVRPGSASGGATTTPVGRFLTAVATDGRVVWAVDGTGGEAAAVDCATGKVLGRVHDGREATAVAAADGRAWVVDSGAGIVIEMVR